VPANNLAYVAPGRNELVFEAGETAVRTLLIGGEPLGERIVMWWNFIGRTHEEIVDYRQKWQDDVVAGGTDAGRYGTVVGYDGSPLPAPVMPGVRLRPRE
jgi:hypothetical protein